MSKRMIHTIGIFLLVIILPFESIACERTNEIIFLKDITPKFWVSPEDLDDEVISEERSVGPRTINAYAVLVGINDYPGSQNDLRGCIADVNAIYDRLVNKYGWSSSNIHKLLDSQATTNNIINELRWLASMENENSQTFFSFSGHGVRGNIVAHNGYLSDDAIAAELKKFDSKENVVIIDACYSGSNTALNLPNFVSMMACGNNELAADGRSFTQAFCRGLDNTQTGEVEDAFQYAYNQVQSYQHPVIWDNYPGKLQLGRRPPRIEPPVPDQTALEDTPIEMDLSMYEKDDVDSGVLLKWSVSSYDANAIKTITGQNSDDDVLTFIPNENWYGTTQVTLKLTNSAGKSATQTVKFIWEPVNDKPEIDRIEKSWSKVERTDSIKIYVYGCDVEDSMDQLEIDVQYSFDDIEWIDLPTPSLKGNKWETTFTPPKESQLGTYDFRAKLKDSSGEESGWFFANDIVQVVNKPPKVISLTTIDSVICRLQNAIFEINSTDAETPLSDLSCILEYSLDYENWYDLNAKVEFNGDIWTATKFFEASAEIGIYSIRCKVIDTDGDESEWYLVNDIIEVRNARPVVDEIILSKNIVERGDTIRFEVRAHDVEDANEYMKCSVEYRAPRTFWSKIEDLEFKDDIWIARYTPDADAVTGNYSVRCAIQDTTNQWSDWYYMNLSFEVADSPPIITSFKLENDEVFREKSVKMWVKGEDFEDSPSDLRVLVEYKSQNSSAWESAYISGSRMTNPGIWEVEFRPTKSASLGEYTLRACLIDSEGVQGEWNISNEKIVVLNNPPKVVISEIPKIVNEGQEITFDASGSMDLENNISITWYFDNEEVNGMIVSYAFKTGGIHKVKVVTIDEDGGETSDEFNITVNFLPLPTFTTRQEISTEGYKIVFDASGSKDPDGRIVAYIWDFDINSDSDGDGISDNDCDAIGKKVEYIYESPGTYVVKIAVKDEEGAIAYYNKTIKVEAISFSGLSGLIIFSSIVIIIGGVVAASLLMRKRKKVIDIEEPSSVATTYYVDTECAPAYSDISAQHQEYASLPTASEVSSSDYSQMYDAATYRKEYEDVEYGDKSYGYYDISQEYKEIETPYEKISLTEASHGEIGREDDERSEKIMMEEDVMEEKDSNKRYEREKSEIEDILKKLEEI